MKFGHIVFRWKLLVQLQMVGQSRQHDQSFSPPPIPTDSESKQWLAAAIVAGLTAATVLLALLLPVENAGNDQKADTVHKNGLGGDQRHAVEGRFDEVSGSDHVLVSESRPTSTSSGPASLVASNSKNSTSSDNSHDATDDRNLPSSDIRDTSLSGDAATETAAATNQTQANAFLTLGGHRTSSSSPEVKNGTVKRGKAEFFGVEAKGSRIIYVVDVSSSMTGEKFEKARQELLYSIERLERDQFYCVVFFNDVAHFPPFEGLVPARSRKRKRETKEWILRASPTGGTSPLEAITYALRLQPDSVYVLSDGEFDIEVVDRVDSLNLGSRVCIHTICFGIDATTLKELASENSGTYRRVQ